MNEAMNKKIRDEELKDVSGGIIIPNIPDLSQSLEMGESEPLPLALNAQNLVDIPAGSEDIFFPDPE